MLSTDDPVRVFQRFSTLDALSNGRAEVILGRGSFTESYPLFGYDLSDYDELFEDKLRLFAELLKGGRVTWSGSHARAAARARDLSAGRERARCSAWVGVGGSPESVVRAARYGLPLTLAIIGGSPQRFKPFVDLYRQSLEQLGQPMLPDRRAFAGPRRRHRRTGEERAVAALRGDDQRASAANAAGRRSTRAQFEREAGPDGALCVGSPETVAAKIVRTAALLGLSRFNLKYSAGTLPHALMTSIELIGTEVAPRVREACARAGQRTESRRRRPADPREEQAEPLLSLRCLRARGRWRNLPLEPQ